MKNLIKIFLLLFVQISFAQRSLSIKVNSSDDQKIATEGVPFFQQNFWPAQTYFNGDGTKNPDVDGGLAGSLSPFVAKSFGGYAIPVTKTLIVRSIRASVSRATYVQVGVTTSSGGLEGIIGVIDRPTSYDKEFRGYAGQSVSSALYGIVVPYTSGQNTVNATSTIMGKLISDDLNFNADRVIFWLGDSNSVGTFGTNTAVTSDDVFSHK